MKSHFFIWLLVSTLVLSGCMHSGIPASSINNKYISSNCSYSLTYTRCSTYSNCDTGPSSNICSCTYKGGVKFTGALNQKGEQWCGVQTNNDGSSYLITNGKATNQKVGLDVGSTALAIVGVAVAAAIVGAAADSGGGGGDYSSPSSEDTDWDWDGFYDSYGIFQWRCRGITTGQFADDSNCLWDTKIDDRWPD
jgi:hypothetical protein